MKFISFLLLFLPLSSLFANDFRIQIEGHFPGAEGQLIRLMEYNDQISYREMEIANSKIDEEGRFSMSFSRFSPQYVFFRIDHARMGFFVEPGESYSLAFDAVDFTLLDDSRNPYLNPWYFNFSLQDNASGLNKHIDRFEDLFHDFLLENFAAIRVGRNRRLFDEFKASMDSIFSEVENEYFQAYYDYKFAYYYRAANIVQFNEQMRTHLLNRPVLYHNTQYMNFFNTVFDTWVFAGSRNITLRDLSYTVNRLNSYDALMDSLGKDTLLRNEVIRELVMLKALQNMHGNPDYRRANVENILSYVAENSRFPEHRKVASNILFQKNNMINGAKAPSIVLKDNDGNDVRIPEDFEGKYLYLGFWASWCETCLLEFIALNELHEKYKDNFVVVNISTDRHMQIYESFVKNTDYPWINLHFNHDFRLLDTYHVKSLPLFVLLDRQGRILEFPARRPSNDLHTLFEYYLFQQRRGRN